MKDRLFGEQIYSEKRWKTKIQIQGQSFSQKWGISQSGAEWIGSETMVDVYASFTTINEN